MFLMPVMRFRVVCGRGETIESFSPTRRFRSVDFPALGRPMSETNPDFNGKPLHHGGHGGHGESNYLDLTSASSTSSVVASFEMRTRLMRRRSASRTST